MSSNSRRKNRERNIPQMQAACIKAGVTYTEFNTCSYRLTKPKYDTVDYFPTSNRIFFHDVQEWGEVTDVKNFIASQFK